MNIPIVINVTNNKNALEATLRSVEACAGKENFCLVLKCDPVSNEIVRRCQSVDFMDKIVVVNKAIQDYKDNVPDSLELVFQDLEYESIFFLEEGYVLSPDALLMVKFFLENKGEGQVLSLENKRSTALKDGKISNCEEKVYALLLHPSEESNTSVWTTSINEWRKAGKALLDDPDIEHYSPLLNRASFSLKYEFQLRPDYLYQGECDQYIFSNRDIAFEECSESVICVLTLNEENTIGDTLEILTEEGHDVIVWDNGSKDNTVEILKRYESQITKVFYSESNVGNSISRNRMIEYALSTGKKYIGFLDGDVVPLKGGFFAMQSVLGILPTEGVFYPSRIKTISVSDQSQPPTRVPTRCLEFIRDKNILPFWYSLYRRHVFENEDVRFPEFPPFDEEGWGSEDVVICDFFKMCGYSVAQLPRVEYVHFFHNSHNHIGDFRAGGRTLNNYIMTLLMDDDQKRRVIRGKTFPKLITDEEIMSDMELLRKLPSDIESFYQIAKRSYALVEKAKEAGYSLVFEEEEDK